MEHEFQEKRLRNHILFNLIFLLQMFTNKQQ